MSFDFSTLITDRTQSDVTKKTTKGFYNASDLNRVTACMEYLDEELRKLGYESGYKPVVVHPQEEPEEPLLPDGYTELEYIESTGTQYIDTGIKPDQNTRAVADAEIVSQTTATVGIMGVRDRAAVNAEQKFILWSMNTGSLARSDWFGSYANVSASISIVGNRMIFDKNKAVCKVGEITLTNTAATGQCTKNLYIFCTNDGANDASYFGLIKLYSFQIYSNDTLLLDCIPCKTVSGDIGLYDTIGMQFLGNSGTGIFTAGPEVPPEPEPEPLDPHTWYESDVPTASQMDQYLSNVAAIRSVFELPEYAPQTPQSMALLTFAKANDIESVLQTVENVIERVRGSLDFGWALGIAHIGLYGGV